MAELKTLNTNAESLITEHLDIWTTAIEQKSSAGRGTSNKFSLYGIKKLRELILELAVRGKLVPQDPNDEPASVLLERIAVKKAQLVKEGKLKKQKSLPEIGEDEKPFELPDGWEWSYIQQIGHDWGQKTPDSEFSYIDVGAINKELGFIEEPSLIDPKDAPSRARKIVKKGTVIYSTVRPYLLNIAVIDKDFSPEPIASTAFAIIHPFDGISATYIYRYFRSPTFITYVESVQNGIAYPAINDKQFFTGLIAIPPKEEQHRIVAKVDELMRLCDALEAQTENSITAHQTLVEVLLEALLKTPEQTVTPEQAASQFEQNWQCVSEHFDTLFTTTASIDTLKQTILQLAVMGKLVPQNPNDEPAAKLLERIAAEKAQLIKDGKIKKQKPLPAITDEEKPFELPKGWEWCSLSSLGYFFGGKTPSKSNSAFWGGDVLWVTPKDMKRTYIYDSEDKITQAGVDSGLNFVEVDSLMCVTRSGILRRHFPVAIAKKQCTVNQDLKVLSFYDNTIAGYVLLMMQGFEQHILMHLTKTGTTVESLKFEEFSVYPFMFPPLEEQHRIVAKVDELMALCDQLKTRLTDAQTTQLHLTDAIVEQAV